MTKLNGLYFNRGSRFLVSPAIQNNCSLSAFIIYVFLLLTPLRDKAHITQRLKKEGEREKEREREHKSMSTLSVPPVPTSPRDDAIALYRAFKGTSLFLSLSLSLFLGNFYTNMLLLLVWSNVVNPLPKKNKNMNSITHIDTNWP